MSDTTTPNVASHTLAYLRRIEQRQTQTMDLLVRRQELIGRLERDMRDGFGTLERGMREGCTRIDRDLKELKSDVVLVEKRILSALTVSTSNPPGWRTKRNGCGISKARASLPNKLARCGL